MSEYTLKWLSDKRMYRELRRVAKNWPHQDVKGIEKLGLVLFETWSAGQRLQPFPEVCLLSSEDTIFGVLCGSIDYYQHNFNIEHVIVARSVDSDQIAYDQVQSELVEAAIDVSQNLGFHGWLSCTPEEGDIPMFRKMGFSLHRDGLTYRRMGYFAQL